MLPIIPFATTLKSRFPTLAEERIADAHKGHFGNAIVIGGAPGMSGAVCLASSAALLLGCGKSYACFCQPTLPMPVVPNFPEIILSTLETTQDLAHFNAIAIGCGMGHNEQTEQSFLQLLNTLNDISIPCVIDADALTMMSKNIVLEKSIINRCHPTILTPHPAEAARLLKCPITHIQGENRRVIARQLATRYRAWIVLKGYQSVLAAPDGTTIRNDSGNAGLATAGSGDVLTGMLIGLLAQKIAIKDAVAGAVWLHGAAADYLGTGKARAGLLAGEIAFAAREIRHHALFDSCK